MGSSARRWRSLIATRSYCAPRLRMKSSPVGPQRVMLRKKALRQLADWWRETALLRLGTDPARMGAGSVLLGVHVSAAPAASPMQAGRTGDGHLGGTAEISSGLRQTGAGAVGEEDVERDKAVSQVPPPFG